MPMTPLGRKGPLPSGSLVPPGPTSSAKRMKSIWGRAEIQKTTRHASASSVTSRVTRKLRATPQILSPTNST
ncbi:hypothetical protein D3C72_2443490 [compost metagenome]